MRLSVHVGQQTVLPGLPAAYGLEGLVEATEGPEASSHQWPDPVPTIYIRGLKPGSIYRTTPEKGPVSGEALMNRGIEVSLSGELSGTMVEITEE